MQKSKATLKAINEQAFAAPEKVAAAVEAVNAALAGGLDDIVQKIQLYLTKPKTQAALQKPIKGNVVEAHRHLRSLLQEHYTSEQAALVPLHSEEALETVLHPL